MIMVFFSALLYLLRTHLPYLRSRQTMEQANRSKRIGARELWLYLGEKLWCLIISIQINDKSFEHWRKFNRIRYVIYNLYRKWRIRPCSLLRIKLMSFDLRQTPLKLEILISTLGTKHFNLSRSRIYSDIFLNYRWTK